MESRLVEFVRPGKLDRGALRGGDRYIVSMGNEPAREFEMTLDHVDYLDMVKALSYKTKRGEREAALASISRLVTDMLGPGTLSPPTEPLQFDLVVNAAELGALQFEAAVAPDGQPLLARDDCAVTLTRRVRGAFQEKRMRWPAKPRVLFAWASPPGAGADVPHAEHLAALTNALKPWIGPDDPQGSRVLTVLEQVTRRALEEALTKGRDDGKPYSHVHLLAHGYPTGVEQRRQFGMALHDDNLELEVLAPDALVEVLAPLRGSAATVMLATCDSANESNALIAERSIAHQLHVSGIPIVLASQYPLTMAGSSLLASSFYGAALAGDDVRVALHKARVALRRNQETAYHDWVSLVCYASLPEGYADVLLDMHLQRILAALRTSQAWLDKLVRDGVDDPVRLDEIEIGLKTAIANLDVHLAGASAGRRKDVLEENQGLLGSAQKRLAELYFHRARLSPAGPWKAPMREALQRSMDWYLKAARSNLSQHWQSVQALSLEAALTGAIRRTGLWHAAVEAALIAKENEAEYWALGSLVELYLLAPLAGQPGMVAEALEELALMTTRLSKLPAEHDDRVFAPESTRRQLQRYVDWWISDNEFFAVGADLRANAQQLRDAVTNAP